MFQPGDRVVIVNKYYCFYDYQEFFDINKLKLLEYKFKNKETPINGTKGVVVYKTLYHKSKHCMVYVIESDDGQIYLLADYGLKHESGE